tara:strand:+ start:1725 stop:2630 length:906 start_codon:yes stop_codon:yes gene_type:complete
MKRLFTFGCSFTWFDWPTWADLLSLDSEYELVENWGFAGLGNVAIAQRISECHSKHNFTKDDTIVVQWTSHLRNDYHKREGWATKGSVFNMHNIEFYTRKWYDQFFNERSYVMHSLNSMTLAQGLLKSTGCKWAMTTIGDFNKLGNDFLKFDGDGENSTVSKTLLEEYPEFNHYIKSIWDDNSQHWTTPIGSFSWQGQQLGENQHITDSPNIYKFVNTNERTSKEEPYWWDPHPSTHAHATWLQECLLPTLDKEITLNDKQSSIINYVDTTYNETEIDLFQFREKIDHYVTDNNFNTYRGY